MPRHPYPQGYCSASCKREDRHSWGVGLRAFSSTFLPAVGSRVCLPGSVLHLGEDTPEQGWAKDPASHLSSDPHTHPVWPSLPTQCPAVPWGAPLDRAGSCQCPVASTVGCYLHSCWGSCCKPPATKVPPGTIQQLWLVLRCSGLCDPRRLSLVIALLCPRSFLEIRD